MSKEERILFDLNNSKKVQKRMELKKEKARIEKLIVIYQSQLVENTKKEATMELCMLDIDIKLKMEVLKNKLEKIEKEIEELS